MKVTDVLPSAIVTDAGRVAAVWLLARLTVIPPVGAAPDKVAVPVDEAPPVTLFGLTVIEDRVGMLIVSVAD